MAEVGFRKRDASIVGTKRDASTSEGQSWFKKNYSNFRFFIRTIPNIITTQEIKGVKRNIAAGFASIGLKIPVYAITEITESNIISRYIMLLSDKRLIR